VPRFLGILIRPETTWREIRAADPTWREALFAHAAPLVLLPSIAWPVGRALQGAGDPIAAGFAATLLLSLACLLLLALGFYLLARFFGAMRNWNRAVVLACYSGTPVFLCGAALIVPLFIIASVGALLYGIGLCATGARIMLECPDGEVPAYVASASMFFGATSMALGALCSAIGLI
jgi:hypothetical protein